MTENEVMKKIILTVPDRLSGSSYYHDIWRGALHGAQSNRVILNTIIYHAMYEISAIEANKTRLSHINKEYTDGVISIIATDDIYKAIEDHQSLPWVNTSTNLTEASNIYTEDKQGIKKVISHMAKEHGHKNFVYIGKQEPRLDAQVRYDGFMEALNELGLNEAYPAAQLPGEFSGDRADEAMKILFDDNKIDVDGIITANDGLALNILNILREKNISVPYDVAVVGFDNNLESSISIPPLASIMPQLFEMGKRCVEQIIAELKGAPIDRKMMVGATPLFRRSCGCLQSQNMKDAVTINQKGDISELIKDSIPLNDNYSRKHGEKLLSLVRGSISEAKSMAFLSELDTMSRRIINENEEVGKLQKTLSIIRNAITRNGKKAKAGFEDLMHQSRILIDELTGEQQQQRQDNIDSYKNLLLSIGRDLVSTLNMDDFKKTLFDGITRLGIKSCYLALFEGSEAHPEYSNIIFAATDGKMMDIKDSNSRFLTKHTLPKDYLPKNRSYNTLQLTLAFSGKELGYIIFEVDSINCSLYETITDQAATAIHSILLLEKIQNNSTILYKGVDRLNELIKDLLGSTEQISQKMEDQACSVEESAGAIEEMVRNIDHTTITSNKADAISSELSQITQESKVTQDRLVDSVMRVSENSNNILGVLVLIKDLVDAINILGLNASIQASKAGVYGKGFSVVAGEIRKLVNKTESNAESIEEMVKSILSQIKDVVNGANKTRSNFDTIESLTSKNAEISHQLMSSMNEQTIGANEILNSTQAMVQITEEVKEAVIEQKNATDQFKSSLQELIDATK